MAELICVEQISSHRIFSRRADSPHVFLNVRFGMARLAPAHSVAVHSASFVPRRSCTVQLRTRLSALCASVSMVIGLGQRDARFAADLLENSSDDVLSRHRAGVTPVNREADGVPEEDDLLKAATEEADADHPSLPAVQKSALPQMSDGKYFLFSMRYMDSYALSDVSIRVGGACALALPGTREWINPDHLTQAVRH